MATVSGNMLTSGIRGKIGDMFVFRQIGGKTFVSRSPRKPDRRRESAAQRNTRTTFKDASRWAKSLLCVPEKKAYYKKRAQEWKLTNAYTAAIKDYMMSAQSKTIKKVAGLKNYVFVNGSTLHHHQQGQPETQNPKPRTRNPETKTRNPKPGTRPPRSPRHLRHAMYFN